MQRGLRKILNVISYNQLRKIIACCFGTPHLEKRITMKTAVAISTEQACLILNFLEKRQECLYCNGNGRYLSHSTDQFGQRSSPVMKQCVFCESTGKDPDVIKSISELRAVLGMQPS